MKAAIFLLLGFALLASGCKDSIPEDCIDESKISDGPCYLILAPVCGCDGKTYGNSCEAMNAGVTYFKNGKCK